MRLHKVRLNGGVLALIGWLAAALFQPQIRGVRDYFDYIIPILARNSSQKANSNHVSVYVIRGLRALRIEAEFHRAAG
jgi:hypothetical protein